MDTEYEVRVLEIDKEKLIKELEDCGAKLNGDWNQKRYVYNTIPTRDGQCGSVIINWTKKIRTC